METKIPSSLESHLGYWLRLVSNHVSQAFARELESRDVSVGEWVALRLLYDGAQAPSTLAARLGMTRGAITKLADRLMRRDLVARKADAADGRAQRLALTASGRALVPRLAALADRNDGEFFNALTAGERTALEKTLKQIAGRHGLDSIPTT